MKNVSKLTVDYATQKSANRKQPSHTGQSKIAFPPRGPAPSNGVLLARKPQKKSQKSLGAKP
jgi:hypothetical protein